MKNRIFFVIPLLISLVVLQGQSYSRDFKTGYQTSKEDGAEFGYYIPQSIKRTKETVPLVVIFGQKAMDALKWQNLAEKEHLIAVSIQPKRGGRWILQADYPRAEAKIKDVLARYPIDKKRVLTLGYGRNGVFALLVGINSPGLVTAAAGIDTTVVNAFVSGGDEGSGQSVGVFNFSSDPSQQIPLLLVNFAGGNQVSRGNQEKTKEVLEKHGYSVTYKEFSGSSQQPDSKNLEQIYSWFRSPDKK